MILVFGMRFLIEFLKMPQVGFEEGMALNMGQLLSIPFVLLGIITIYLINRKDKIKKSPL
jgi:prolipoprotein diacylglyceryltransferase